MVNLKNRHHHLIFYIMTKYCFYDTISVVKRLAHQRLGKILNLRYEKLFNKNW